MSPSVTDVSQERGGKRESWWLTHVVSTPVCGYMSEVLFHLESQQFFKMPDIQKLF